ncbi:Water stress and hypersensitive response domain-containing protein [Halovenus rubra]|uniref:Water stress and hypersensitive response domain-containing protein n=2 Tax=Halovenus rubra TaxID=869890 RepID=A0ABD5XD45_9EURY|nr:hypothetical protein [Halovenus rubra]
MDWEKVKRFGKIGGLVVVVGIALVGGLSALGLIGVPDAGLADNSWGEVEDERIEVLTTVRVDNPNPVGGGDGAINYGVALQGVRLAEGEGTGLSLPSGESTHEFRTDLFYNRLSEWWYRHLRNDEVSDLQVNATANVSSGPFSGSPSGTYEDTIDTDIQGALNRGFSTFEGTYSGTETGLTAPDGTAIEPTVEVDSVTTEWGNVTEAQTNILVTVDITNPNAYPIPTPAFTGYVAMNDIRVADWDADEVTVLEVTDEGLIPPGETEKRTFRIEMDNKNVPEWFATHVDRGEQSTVEVAGQLALDISGSEVTIPQDGSGVSCKFDLTTAIFVNQSSDMQRQQCGTTPLSIAQGTLDGVGASLDITETDWWLNFDDNSDDDSQSGGEDDDDDDGLVPSRERLTQK